MKICPALKLFSTLSIMVVATTTSVGFAYQLVLDGEDTSYRTISGNWTLDKTGSFQGNYRFSSTKGTGQSLAAWDIDSIPDGSYNVEFYVDNGNYAAAAEFIVEDDTGISTVTKSQNYVGAGWHAIGTYEFTGAGRIIQTDQWVGAGTKVIADALRLTYIGTPPDAPADSAPPEVTLVIDDLGALNPYNSGTYTYTLFNNHPEVTYAVIPQLSYTDSVMADAHAKDIVTILHQPMEYIGGSTSGDPTRLFVNLTSGQILNTINSNLLDLKPVNSPFSLEGVNNHQGSKFSEYREGLEVALGDLKSRGLFFLDSRTISDSVAYDIGREKGMLIGERDLFVDGTSVANTVSLIESVAQQALYAPNYNYIMICHQRTDTVPGVLQALPIINNWGVTVKPLKKNMHYMVETDMIPPGASVELDGPWTSTTQDMISHECFDGDSLELANETTGSVIFRPNLPEAGQYRVFVGNQFAQATVNHKTGAVTKSQPITQTRHNWAYLGSYPFDAGTAGYVTISTDSTLNGNAEADSVKFVYDGPQDLSQVKGWNTY